DVSGTSFTGTAVSNGVAAFYQIVPSDNFGNTAVSQPIIGATPSGPDGFDPNGTLDDAESATYMSLGAPWTYSNARSFSTPLSYRNASGGTGATYTNNTCGYITTPAFTVPTDGEIQFRARFDIEVNWDGVVVETSTDGGTNWTPIAPVEGYPSTLSQTGNPPINACGFPASQGAFTGTSGGNFNTYTLDLSGFTGQSIMVRWAFTSDPGSEEEGFYLDNVSFSGSGNPDQLLAASFEDGENPPGSNNYICTP
ncbi:MAG: immune inhibitor A, partial [Xanthomonadales bacterium]|nr:immune inhibitor A [Xanthomonadales bacterium]